MLNIYQQIDNFLDKNVVCFGSGILGYIGAHIYLDTTVLQEIFKLMIEFFVAFVAGGMGFMGKLLAETIIFKIKHKFKDKNHKWFS